MRRPQAALEREGIVGRGLSDVQGQILGVVYRTQEVLRDWGLAEDRPHFVNRLGLWAIYHHPAGGRRMPLNSSTTRAARVVLSRAATRLARRGLLARYRRSAWVLTPWGEEIGRGKASPFQGLVDLRALCGLEILWDAAEVARRQWGRSLEELRAELWDRVRDGARPGECDRR
jgi:hypothetical protein